MHVPLPCAEMVGANKVSAVAPTPTNHCRADSIYRKIPVSQGLPSAVTFELCPDLSITFDTQVPEEIVKFDLLRAVGHNIADSSRSSPYTRCSPYNRYVNDLHPRISTFITAAANSGR